MLHSFFTNGLCPYVVLHPFAETAQVMKNHQLLLKRAEGVFSMYAGSENGTEDLFSNLNSLEPLYFQLLVSTLLQLYSTTTNFCFGNDTPYKYV